MAGTITLSPRVRIDGRSLPTDWQAALLDLRVELALNVPGRVTMRFSDPGYALLTSGTASLQAPIEVTDPAGSQTLLEGSITSVGCEQREGEQPELVVVGHDGSYKLGLGSHVQTWSTATVAEVIRALATSSGLDVHAGPSASTTHLPYLLQVDTDLGLLGELARRLGADWWVTGSTLYVGAPDELMSTRKGVSLTLGDGLLAFSARAVPVPERVSVTGWDVFHQQTVKGQAERATHGVVPTSELVGEAKAGTFVTAAVGARSGKEADTLSQSLFDLRAGAAVEATGTAEGNGTLAPGGTVTVRSAGPLSGTYPLSAAEHVYRPRRGYMTRFRSGDRRPAGLAAEGRRRGNAQMDGSVVGHHGATAGVVTNINDPTRMGRVKVRFPGMSATQESAWARVVAAGGGVTRGNVFIPEVDDEVLVAFEDGDTRAPVVIGGLYGAKSTIPEPTLKTGKVQKREIVSRLGHVIRLLDGESTPADKAIELVLADGESSIHLGEDGTTVTVKPGNPFTVTAGSTSIEVAKDSGALSVKAPTVEIEATDEIKLSAPKVGIAASTTLTLKGSASVGMTGALVRVKATTMLGITGKPVSINGA